MRIGSELIKLKVDFTFRNGFLGGGVHLQAGRLPRVHFHSLFYPATYFITFLLRLVTGVVVHP